MDTGRSVLGEQCGLIGTPVSKNHLLGENSEKVAFLEMNSYELLGQI